MDIHLSITWLSVLYLWLTITPVELTPYCTAYNSSPNPTDPKLPTLPNRFQATVEANILDKNKTETCFEYYDYKLQKATLIRQDNGVKKIVIYDYKNNEIFRIVGYSCLNHTNISVFGNGTTGHMHMYNTYEMFRLTNSSGQKYMGRTIVRGINVDHWQSCQYSAGQSLNFTLDYYFTVANWLEPIVHPQVPVRAVLQGVTVKSGVVKNIHHYYDYVDFKLNVTDPTVFETPPGVYCPGRKQLRPVPKIPKFFHYKIEIISDETTDIRTADVWYDDVHHLIRTDTKLIGMSPLNTMNAFSEITDFKYGINYYIDKVTGKCKTTPIQGPMTYGLVKNKTIGESIIYMSGPKHLFWLDGNFTYNGQRRTRGLLCDVFMSSREGSDIAQNTIPAGIIFTLEFYFLAEKYTTHPDVGYTQPQDVPIMLIVTSPALGISIQYNYLEFDQTSADLAVFDVSSCYSMAASLQLSIKFSGHINNEIAAGLAPGLVTNVTSALGVSPLRVHDVGINYDMSFIYASAKVLGRLSTTSQFSQIAMKCISTPADKSYPYTQISTAEKCAIACVNSVDLICLSFDFGANNKTQTCRLFKTAYTNTSVLTPGKCDHYYRNLVAQVPQEVNLTSAFDNLMSTVRMGGLLLTAYLETQLEPLIYKAVDVSVVSGYLYKPGTPSLDSQFSYHLENSIPNIQQVFNSHIWYDYMYKLVRYDVLNGDPVTIIHDYNSGLAYTIHKLNFGCTVKPIDNSSFDVVSPSSSQISKTGYVLQMKDPLQLFYLTNNYVYTGQKTVRSMMCDVYENVGPFNFAGTVKDALFQYYFMSGGWHELSSGSGLPVPSQPVSLEVTASDGSELEHFDFYDFNQQHPDLTNFNIQPCFQPNQQVHFLITFNQSYHPILDRNLALFQRNVQEQLSVISTVSPLRFQNPEITYQDQVTYYIATMVEQAPIIFDFTKTVGKQSIRLMDASYSKIKSASQCAGMCRNVTTFACLSFDYCPSTKLCVLSKEHIDDGTALKSTTTCDHYSKTVSGKLTIEPTVQQAFTMFQDRIARGTFIVPLQVSANLTIRFPAVYLDRKILRFDYAEASSTTLSHFTLYDKQALLTNPQLTVKKVSIDKCANRCIMEPTFDCQGFSYCPLTGVCLLSSSNPTQGNATISKSMIYRMYARKYLDSYVPYPGFILSDDSGTQLTNIVSADICASKCSQKSAGSMSNSNNTCRSFDFCESTRTCYLKHSHALDLYNKSLASSVACSHYSRKFLFDFTKTPHRTLITKQTVTFYYTSLEMCAKLGVERDNSKYQAFTYCPIDSTCHLEPNQTKLSHSQIKTNQNCDLYTRHPVHNGPQNPTTGPSSSQISNKSSGYGPGAMAGVAVGMLIVGLLFGAALQYFLRTKHLVDRKIQYEMQTVRQHTLKGNEEEAE